MPAVNLMSLTDDQKKKFLDSFDSVITDCDGVLWHSTTPVPGAIQVMNSLPALNKKRFYFTNNSTKTREEFVEKFKSLGFDATVDEVLSTAWLTAQYLKNIHFNKKIYVIGTKAIEKELACVGIEGFGAGPDPYTSDEKPGSVELRSGVGGVVIGYDFHFSLTKLTKGCTYLCNPDTLFIATNTDERFPVSDGLCLPGAGAFVAALEKCAERAPQVMGKPSPLAVDRVLSPSGVDPRRCLMIGDRCNTDIQFGNQRGMTTLLVETGVHRLSHLEKYEADHLDHLIPTYYTSSIADLLKIIKSSS